MIPAGKLDAAQRSNWATTREEAFALVLARRAKFAGERYWRSLGTPQDWLMGFNAEACVIGPPDADAPPEGARFQNWFAGTIPDPDYRLFIFRSDSCVPNVWEPATRGLDLDLPPYNMLSQLPDMLEAARVFIEDCLQQYHGIHNEQGDPIRPYRYITEPLEDSGHRIAGSAGGATSAHGYLVGFARHLFPELYWDHYPNFPRERRSDYPPRAQ